MIDTPGFFRGFHFSPDYGGSVFLLLVVRDARVQDWTLLVFQLSRRVARQFEELSLLAESVINFSESDE